MILQRVACLFGIHGSAHLIVPLDSGFVSQCERCGRHIFERTVEPGPVRVAMWVRSRRHLAEAGSGYWQHLRFAMLAGVIAIAAGLACVIHALVPALCPRTCSRTIAQLNQLFSSPQQWQQIQQQGSGVLVFVMLVALAGATATLPMIAGAPLGLTALVAVLAFSIPATFLLTNPDLEMVEN